MTDLDALTDEQFRQQALQAIRRELGDEGLARFLRLDRSRAVDYTADRAEWQKKLALDEILDSIRLRRRS